MLRLARENPAWGYGKLEGELRKLGYTLAQSTIRDVLRRNKVPPAPKRRRSGSTWRTFLRVPCKKAICGMRALRRAAVIVMQHAAQDVAPLDRPVACCAFAAHRTLLAKALMRSRPVVVRHILGQHTAQMPFAEDQ